MIIEVIWQKLAVELIKLWDSIFSSENFYPGSILKFFMGFVSKNIFWPQIT